MVRHTTYLHKSGISYKVTKIFHILCGIFLCFLTWGFLLSVSEGVPVSSMLHIVLLQLLALGGVVYQDSWFFDIEEQKITSIYGFGPFCKKESYAFDEVERLEITHFVRGLTDTGAKPTKRRLRSMIVFSLRLTHDRIKDIEIIAEKVSGGRTEASFGRIGSVTKLPLYMDRPQDLDLHVSYKDSRWQ